MFKSCFLLLWIFLNKKTIFATMKKKNIKIITAITLVALLSVQGIWLNSTYSLLHQNLITNLEDGFARSIEKEIYLRFDNYKNTVPEGSLVVRGARPDQDFYSNALAFHEFLLSCGVSFSMETLDSIWTQKLKENFGKVNYILQKTDAEGNPVETIQRGANEKSSRTLLIIERPVRNDHSELLRVMIESPYKIVLRQMMFLLITSLLIALILSYCLYYQIRIIILQNRIAAVRQDFTYAMVHDMKNPVANILMSADTLKTGKIDEKIEIKNRCVDIIVKDGNRLLAFTNKILTIAQLEERKIMLSKRHINLNELLNRLIEEYLINPVKEIRFTTDLKDVDNIHADPEYMTDVCRNLIDNAIKYSKETVTIQIKAKKDRKHTIIQFKDNGWGISRKDQKRIFKKFERILSGKKEQKSGFGLGLYYVYLVVDAHGGAVKVESVPDVYSEFTIIIPSNNYD